MFSAEELLELANKKMNWHFEHEDILSTYHEPGDNSDYLFLNDPEEEGILMFWHDTGYSELHVIPYAAFTALVKIIKVKVYWR